MLSPRKIRRVNQQTHEGPRQGAGQGLPAVTKRLFSASAFRNVPEAHWSRSSDSTRRSPPQKALLDYPAPAQAPLPHAPVFPSPRRTLVSKVSLFLQSPRAANPGPTLSARLVKVQIPHRKEKSHLADTCDLPGRCPCLHRAGPWTWLRLRLHFQNRVILFARPCFQRGVTTTHRGLPLTRGFGDRACHNLPPNVSCAHLQNGVETHLGLSTECCFL